MIIYQEKIEPPQAPSRAEDPTEWRKTEAKASDHLRVKNLIEAIGGIIRRLQEKIGAT
jgi:hypothetical protein